MGFTHLSVASSFSAHFGTAEPSDLVDAAVADGADAAAITDRDGIYGAIRHVRQCLDRGIAPIVGVRLQIAEPAELTEVTVLAHGHNDGNGWAAMCRLVSAAHMSRRPRNLANNPSRPAAVPRDRPQAMLRGLDGTANASVLLGPDSDVGRAIANDDHARARRLLLDWKSRLRDGVAIEIVSHLTRPGTPYSIGYAARMLELADLCEVPSVLTNAARYLDPADAITGDVLDAVRHLQPLGTFEPQPNGQPWLKPGRMMRRLAQEIVSHSALESGETNRLLARTEELANRCRLDPDSDLHWRQPMVPELETIGITGDPAKELWAKCHAAIPARYAAWLGTSKLDQVYDRLRMEMGTIEAFGFPAYFLTVADVSQLITRMGVRNQARGSAAGSLVVYLLGISHVDPLEHDLLFERFLGNKRSTLPDIDIDLEAARRHEVYRAVFDRYGSHRTALMSMPNRYRARGAARDAGLALGLDPDRIDWLAKNLWRFEAADFREVLDQKPELREVARQVREDGRLDLLVDITERLDSLPRHMSMHPCGIILGDQNLLSRVPVQPSGMGLAQAQIDKDDHDDVGLLKVDLLGVRMQSAMAYALTEIHRIHGPNAATAGGFPADAPFVRPDGHIDLDGAPHDDEPTFAAIRTTHTLGMFQIESPGQRELIGKMQPDRYEDLIADISLFRPGPMKANMIGPFIDTKHGIQKPEYLHPLFAPFTQDSYGVMIYHEHVLRVLAICMRITLSEADEIRRAMSDHLDEIGAEFRSRTSQTLDENGKRTFTDNDIDKIWADLAAFGSYGFCKAHAASFAIATWQSALLKTRYPSMFLAGVLTHDPGMYPKRLLVGEARRLGIPILGIDVNRSNDEYRVEQVGPLPPGQPAPVSSLGIRMSLADVHGIQARELARIVAGQPYDSIADFYGRAQPSRPLLSRLAAVGALDSLATGDAGVPVDRGSVIAYVRELVAKKRRAEHRDTANELDITVDDRAAIPLDAPSLSPTDRVQNELSVFGMDVTGHIIDPYRIMLEDLGYTPANQLVDLWTKTPVLVAGIRVATQTPPTKSGKRVVFLSLDDGNGIADCTFFDEAQQAAGPLLFGTRLMLVRGRTRRTGARGVSVEAEMAWDLRELYAEWHATKRVNITEAK